MKTQIFLASFLVSCLMYLSYLLGEKKGMKVRNDIEISTEVQFQKAIFKNEISNRYLKIYGLPSNSKQQCKFDYIIYNDSTFCK